MTVERGKHGWEKKRHYFMWIFLYRFNSDPLTADQIAIKSSDKVIISNFWGSISIERVFYPSLAVGI
jgi:hypothetical protein